MKRGAAIYPVDNMRPIVLDGAAEATNVDGVDAANTLGGIDTRSARFAGLPRAPGASGPIHRLVAWWQPGFKHL